MTRVYFYHTQDIQHILRRMRVGEFPSHFLYGATRLEEHGIRVLWHRSRLGLPRWRMMLRNAWQVISRYKEFDAIYATHYRGLELVVMLRAVGLLRKPIIVWHHQPVITPHNRLREWLGRLFYRGMDRMIFFSDKIVNDSLRSPKAPRERVVRGHWGADLDFYDHLKTTKPNGPHTFISTGKEMRDMPTLVNAFSRSDGARLDIYVNRRNGDVSYEDILGMQHIPENVVLHYCDRLMPYELSLKVREAACVAICCQETKYTVGLTTLVEALAMGLPVISSRNPQYPIDIDAEGCGISVAYGDVEGWRDAIQYIIAHPDEARAMGQRGRALAERLYNDRHCAEEVAEVIKSTLKKPKRRFL